MAAGHTEAPQGDIPHLVVLDPLWSLRWLRAAGRGEQDSISVVSLGTMGKSFQEHSQSAPPSPDVFPCHCPLTAPKCLIG